MPPVCSNRVRRSAVSVTPKRSATPGRYQTGSIGDLGDVDLAGCGDDLAVRPQLARRGSRRLISGMVDVRPGDRDGRPDVEALRRAGSANTSPTTWPQGSSETIFFGVRPLRKGPDRHRRRGVGEVRAVQRVEATGGDRERPVERVATRVGADHVAPAGIAEGCDHRPAYGRARRPPGDLRRLRPTRPGMRGERDVPCRCRPLGARISHRLSIQRCVRSPVGGEADFVGRRPPMAIGRGCEIH